MAKRNWVGGVSGTKWCYVRHNAARGNYDLTVTHSYLAEVYDAQGRRCFYTGLPIDDSTMSLDRVDSNIGYVVGNVRWTHKDVNLMKWDFPEPVFREICRLVTQPLLFEAASPDLHEKERHPNWGGCGRLSGNAWNHIINHAKSRGIAVDMTIDQAWDKFVAQRGKCALTGLTIGFGDDWERTASLDRADSSIGYVCKNVRWVHKHVNKAKRAMSDADFLRYCRLVTRNGHKVAVASGYFDPIHVGHIRYLSAAAEYGTYLIVIVNNDQQAASKKGRAFQPAWERSAIVGSMKFVDEAIIATDTDRSIAETLTTIEPTPACFLNGGDVRSESDCRESEACRKLGIRMEFGVGGFDKIRSSSELIRGAVSPP